MWCVDAKPLTRLLLISVGEGYGGAERNIELTVAALQDHHRVWVFASHATHLSLLGKIARGHTRIIGLPWIDGRLCYWRAVLTVLRWYIVARPDAVIANTNMAARLLASAARLWPWIDRRSFLYVHDLMWRNREYIFRHLPTARLLCPSRMVLDAADYLPPRPGTVIPPMADPPTLSLPQSGENYALHLATINPWKGHVHLIGAATLIRQRGGRLPIISAGLNAAPELAADLRRRIDQGGLTTTFQLLPHEDDPTALLANCLCVVVTSVAHSGGPETFGRTIIEAWCHQRPVVAFACGAIASLVDHGENGLLVEEGDEAGLAEALLRLQRDSNLARRLGRAGYQKAVARFSTATVSSTLLRTLGNDQERRGKR